MGYSSGGKNSVSSISSSYSSKNSSDSKNSVRVSSSDSKNSSASKNSTTPLSSTTRSTKRLGAAKGIRELLTMVEELEGLIQERAAMDKKIETVQAKIENELSNSKNDPVFDKLKQYILKM